MIQNTAWPAPVTEPSSLTMRSMPESSEKARAFVAAWFATCGFCTDIVHDARLVGSELVTNAHRHATAPGEPITVRLYLSDYGPVIEVIDPSDRVPVLRDPSDPFAVSGRGLALVAALTRTWGTNPLATGGKVVYAILPGI
ncbi:ATP-binding protein [Actinomadura atramentaria]|uniref:ATP-binding protein n=1 Tax=Actinomadura atramentaria TaxID=1990 RepID=UPI001F0B02A7|nr:ATP-binding protein [Actinomadura atramentaria]